MALFQFITRAFIDVFGITHPTPKQERLASIFISSMLGLIIAGLALFFLVMYLLAHR
jgi:hypothetical protein